MSDNDAKKRMALEVFIQLGESMESSVRNGPRLPKGVKEQLGSWLSQAGRVWLLADLSDGQDVRLSRAYDALFYAYQELQDAQ